MADAERDNNRETTIVAVSSVDLATPVNISVNPVTNAVIVEVA